MAQTLCRGILNKEVTSQDYHDFVFSGGKLVGEFDQMYKKSSAVPWHQDQVEKHLDARVAKEMLLSYAPFESVLEIGSGLGYFANFVLPVLGSEHFLATDISQTAVDKGSKLFPQIDFKVFDIAGPINSTKVPGITDRRFSLVIVRACFWYLFPALETVVNNLTSLVSPGGTIFVSQNFPPLDSPFIGKEVLPSPDALIEKFLPYFTTLARNDLSIDSLGKGNDNWTMYLGQRK